jgi:hypothetical protein
MLLLLGFYKVKQGNKKDETQILSTNKQTGKHGKDELKSDTK